MIRVNDCFYHAKAWKKMTRTCYLRSDIESTYNQKEYYIRQIIYYQMVVFGKNGKYKQKEFALLI